MSLNEWLSLMEGLEQGLHQSSLTGFYRLSRAILVKSEADFDRFDQAFLEFFRDVPYQGELPQELLDWLDRPCEDLRRTLEELRALDLPGKSIEEILELLEQRLQEQKEEHNGGSYWVGTQGRSLFGNSGWRPGGIRIGGRSLHRTAVAVAGERKYRDFRRDNTLDTRQFQLAFRLLQQMTAQHNEGEKVLDVDGTIRDTCDNGGVLKLRETYPRKNGVKVLLLMDCGGSMDYYAQLCSMLFQAATRSNHFKELHTYYFHNCVYDALYRHPRMGLEDKIPTQWVLDNYDSGYKVILVGDAAMSPDELLSQHYDWARRTYGPAGMEWLERLKSRYPYLIWLNPEPLPTVKNYWTQTHLKLSGMFPMYELTAQGLEQGMRRLMARKA